MGRLGFTYGGSENILPYVKYDARSGRFFRIDRVEKNGKYENNAVEISFQAVMDLENIEVGYINFVDGKAPEYLLVPANAPWPAKPPADGWKQGVRSIGLRGLGRPIRGREAQERRQAAGCYCSQNSSANDRRWWQEEYQLPASVRTSGSPSCRQQLVGKGLRDGFRRRFRDGSSDRRNRWL